MHKVESKKIYEKFLLTTTIGEKEYRLLCKVSPKKITLMAENHDKFEFDRSTPSTILALARMMKKIVSIHDKLYDTKKEEHNEDSLPTKCEDRDCAKF